jgi:hypothetical protein
LAPLAIGLALAAGCAIFGGQPTLARAGKTGTSRVFPASAAETTAAITNAFANHRYRGMSLYNAAGQDYLVPGWHPSNGFALEPALSVDGSITNLPAGMLMKKSVPYVAYFHIVTTPLGTDATSVTVRTILAEVIDGKEPGVHGGWANHYRKVHPMRQEEENVLAAVAEQLSTQTKTISPTPSK